MRGVIGVVQIFVIEFAIAWERMAVVAEKPRLVPIKGRFELLEHLRPEVILQGLHVLDIGSEHDAAMSRNIEPTQPVLRVIEIGGHAAPPIYAAAEWNFRENAHEVVSPLMIGADEISDANA